LNQTSKLKKYWSSFRTLLYIQIYEFIGIKIALKLPLQYSIELFNTFDFFMLLPKLSEWQVAT